ncbi:MAG: endonuclease III domain-containing protein [Pirellulales bacterium]|nr:endonuclease III domain-containing protein [Pirellulales bacterium]
MSVHLKHVFDTLLAALGPQHWWPGESRLEIMVGTVLVQNTSWRNVERAIGNLRESGVLNLVALLDLPIQELADLIRPAGYFQVKAKRLQNLFAFIRDDCGRSLETMFGKNMESLREQLLGIHGIGPETADAILLYAGGMPSFVVDSYTHRILARHGWIGYEADYHEIKDYFELALPQDPQLFNEYHALLVCVGKDFCKRTNPKCPSCPLIRLLPSHGIIEPA